MLYNSLMQYSNDKTNIGSYDATYGWGAANWDKKMLYTRDVEFIRKDGTMDPLYRNNGRYNENFILEKNPNSCKASIISAAAKNSKKTKYTPDELVALKIQFKAMIQHIILAETENKIGNIEYMTNSSKKPNKIPNITVISTTRTYLVPEKDAKTQNYKVLILGPWGCGAFAPEDSSQKTLYRKMVAESFNEVITNTEEITKAVYDAICFSFMPDVAGPAVAAVAAVVPAPATTAQTPAIAPVATAGAPSLVAPAAATAPAATPTTATGPNPKTDENYQIFLDEFHKNHGIFVFSGDDKKTDFPNFFTSTPKRLDNIIELKTTYKKNYTEINTTTTSGGGREIEFNIKKPKYSKKNNNKTTNTNNTNTNKRTKTIKR